MFCWCLLWLVLTLEIPWIRGQKDCQTIITAGGTQNPEKCVFPFKFQDKVYSKCTIDYDPKKIPWCSVEVDENGEHVSKEQRWGHCDLRLCLDPRQTVRTSLLLRSKNKICRTVGGAKPNKICHFPFLFHGKTYYECTTDAADDGIPWCSTFVDTNGTHIQGNWGHCECSDGSGLLTKETDCNVVPIYERVKWDPKFKNIFAAVGGEITYPTAYPFAVLIGAKKKGSSENKVLYVCGGTLITKRHVLTAAHCYAPNIYQYEEILLGEGQLANKRDCIFFRRSYCSEPIQKIKINKFIVHPDYRSQPVIHDIAIIRMDEDARFSASVQRVCLASPNTDKLPQNLVSVGWGQTQADSQGLLEVVGAPSAHLLSVNLPLRNASECLMFWPHIQEKYQICAGTPGRGSCFGDSGGPLLVQSSLGLDSAQNSSSNTYLQVGIVSFGSKNCGGEEPAVYTRVSAYRKWIEENLN